MVLCWNSRNITFILRQNVAVESTPAAASPLCIQFSILPGRSPWSCGDDVPSRLLTSTLNVHRSLCVRRVRIVAFSRPNAESAAPCSSRAARGRICSAPLEHEWQPGLSILSGLCTRRLVRVGGAGEGSPHLGVEEREWGGQKRAGRDLFLVVFFLPCTAVGTNSFWSHLFILVGPQAVATLVDIRILNSQSAYLENESQKDDRGRRSVETGDERPSWQRNRLRPVWSGLVWSDGSTNGSGKKKRSSDRKWFFWILFLCSRLTWWNDFLFQFRTKPFMSDVYLQRRSWTTHQCMGDKGQSLSWHHFLLKTIKRMAELYSAVSQRLLISWMQLITSANPAKSVTVNGCSFIPMA